MSKIVFGTDGWRGLIARDFTFDNVNLVAKALAYYVRDTYRPDRPVVIGYDTRFLAKEFALEVSNVINLMGYNTLVSDAPIPTPAIAFAALHYNSAGAIMLTASHNPPQYCGIKYIPDYAGPATPEITDEIVSNVQLLADGSLKFREAETKGKMEYFNPKEEYFKAVKFLLSDKLKNSELKVAYDPLYATGLGYTDTLLSQVSKCKVATIHNHQDPTFGGGMPDPSDKYLGDLKKFVVENGFDLGLANDGDSDRFGVIDEKGNYYSPNQVISLLLRHLVKNRDFKGSVVRTVATTHLLDKLAKHYNVNIIETPVGFKYVGAQMRNTEVIIGGEESGGLSILGHIPEKDGVLADILVVEMLAYENKSLSEIWKDLTTEVGYEPFGKRLDLHLTDENKKLVMSTFRHNTPQNIGDLKVTGVKTIDGVKILFEDTNSWILVRPSGTEPLIRVYIETDSSDKLEMLEKSVKAILPEHTEH